MANHRVKIQTTDELLQESLAWEDPHILDRSKRAIQPSEGQITGAPAHRPIVRPVETESGITIPGLFMPDLPF